MATRWQRWLHPSRYSQSASEHSSGNRLCCCTNSSGEIFTSTSEINIVGHGSAIWAVGFVTAFVIGSLALSVHRGWLALDARYRNDLSSDIACDPPFNPGITNYVGAFLRCGHLQWEVPTEENCSQCSAQGAYRSCQDSPRPATPKSHTSVGTALLAD